MNTNPKSKNLWDVAGSEIDWSTTVTDLKQIHFKTDGHSRHQVLALSAQGAEVTSGSEALTLY